jgi:hypothetical protein
MKTLKLVTLVFAIALSDIAFARTAFDLPAESNYINLTDNLQVMTPIKLSHDLFNTTPAISFPLKEDTIVIDLQEVVITQGFPEASHDCLQRQVTYPDFAKREHIEGVVVLTMRFNSDGNVEIIDSFGSDSRLESYVHSKLYNIHLKDCAVQMNKPYNLKFTFRMI